MNFSLKLEASFLVRIDKKTFFLPWSLMHDRPPSCLPDPWLDVQLPFVVILRNNANKTICQFVHPTNSAHIKISHCNLKEFLVWVFHSFHLQGISQVYISLIDLYRCIINSSVAIRALSMIARIKVKRTE